MAEWIGILNRKSGFLTKIRIIFVKKKVHNALDKEIKITATSNPQDIKEIIEKMAADGSGRIVNFGGDGWQDCTGNEIIKSGKRITLLPFRFGFANDFARNLGISTLEDNLQALKEGEEILVDVGRVKGTNEEEIYFLNHLGIGFDGETIRKASFWRDKIPLPSGFLLYVPIILWEFLWLKPFSFKTSDKADFRKASILLFLNGPSFAKIFKLAPQAEMNDGFLDVFTLRWEGRLKAYLDILYNAWRLLKSFPKLELVGFESSRVELFKAEKLTIQLSKEAKIEIGGEPFLPKGGRLEISVVPKRLRVRVPQKAA